METKDDISVKTEHREIGLRKLLSIPKNILFPFSKKYEFLKKKWWHRPLVTFFIFSIFIFLLYFFGRVSEPADYTVHAWKNVWINLGIALIPTLILSYIAQILYYKIFLYLVYGKVGQGIRDRKNNLINYMNKTSNRFLSDNVISGFVFICIVISIVFTTFAVNLHIPNSGQHTGYVTSVEQSGLIWKTWTVYIKTDPQSSQEDSYCVSDPAVISELQRFSSSRNLLTLNYSVPVLVWKWQCGGEQSIITSIAPPTFSNGVDLSKFKTNNTAPQSYRLPNGTIVNLQADGTYQ